MIGKAKWALKETKLRVKYKMAKDCIFCQIVSGVLKTDVVAEGENVMAFNDINPVSETHIVIIPKRHIDSVLTIVPEDGRVLTEMFAMGKILIEQNRLQAYRIAFNGGKFQHVPHLHMHLLAGKKIEWSRL